MIDMTPVESSNIASVGFDPYAEDESVGILFVNFKNGAEFCYHQVPTQKYADFIAAESKGKYYFANVKGKYEHEKLRNADVSDKPARPKGKLQGDLVSDCCQAECAADSDPLDDPDKVFYVCSVCARLCKRVPRVRKVRTGTIEL